MPPGMGLRAEVVGTRSEFISARAVIREADAAAGCGLGAGAGRVIV